MIFQKQFALYANILMKISIRRNNLLKVQTLFGFHIVEYYFSKWRLLHFFLIININASDKALSPKVRIYKISSFLPWTLLTLFTISPLLFYMSYSPQSIPHSHCVCIQSTCQQYLRQIRVFPQKVANCNSNNNKSSRHSFFQIIQIFYVFE